MIPYNVTETSEKIIISQEGYKHDTKEWPLCCVKAKRRREEVIIYETCESVRDTSFNYVDFSPAFKAEYDTIDKAVEYFNHLCDNESEGGGDEVNAENVGAVNAAAVSKPIPIDADSFPIVDSAAANIIKRLTFANLKTWIATWYNDVAVTMINKTIDAANNVISNIGVGNFDEDTMDSFNLINGLSLDSVTILVESDGATITFTLEKEGGGDIRFSMSDGVHVHDCTPADSIDLIAGSDGSPTMNYIYILQSTKLLTVSTVNWPDSNTEYVHVASVLCPSVVEVQADGCRKVHAWTDQVSNGNGHLTHLNDWVRSRPAGWLSGALLTPSVGASIFDIIVSAGIVKQLHPHATPLFDTSLGSVVYIINHPDTPYRKATDLTQTFVDKDANGDALGTNDTDHYNLVIWGVVSEGSGDCQLYCNLPNGAYKDNGGGEKAVNDKEQTAIYDIPSEYSGVGFLISRLTVQENGGTYTILQNQDLRGAFPSTAAGGGATGGNEFPTNVHRLYDPVDSTKQIEHDASNISTGETRKLIVPDYDVDLGAMNEAIIKASIMPWVTVCSGSGVDLTLGIAETYRMLFAFEITSIRASVSLAPDGDDIDVIIKRGGVTVGTITIDDGDKTSVGSGTAVTIPISTLADDDELVTEILTAGVAVKGRELKVSIIGYII